MEHEDHFRTLVWHGEIQYGKYTANEWFSLGGPKHPLFQANLRAVKSKPELFEGFNLYITGGLLENWHSWDVDWALVGPYEPARIQAALDWIIECGYEHRLWPDATYSQEFFNIWDWQFGKIEPKEDWLYHMSNQFSKAGVKKNLDHYKQIDGFYKTICKYPFPKNLEKIQAGYQYQQPLKIF